MAINITMMFGRIGSVLGTNIVGLTLDKHCDSTFAVSASIMVLCGIFSFFIPKIRRIDGRRDNKWRVKLNVKLIQRRYSNSFIVKSIITILQVYNLTDWLKYTSVPCFPLWIYQMLFHDTWKDNWVCHWPGHTKRMIFIINQQHARHDAHVREKRYPSAGNNYCVLCFCVLRCLDYKYREMKCPLARGSKNISMRKNEFPECILVSAARQRFQSSCTKNERSFLQRYLSLWSFNAMVTSCVYKNIDFHRKMQAISLSAWQCSFLIHHTKFNDGVRQN